MMTNELRLQAETALLNACQKLESYFKKPFPLPTLFFDVKGTKGGYAKYSTWSIHINPILFTENVKETLEVTIPHEVAHLGDKFHYNGWGHGRTWKSIMSRVMGLAPNRCHSMDVDNARAKRVKRFIYMCPCCAEELGLTIGKHEKVQKGIKIWHGVGRCKWKRMSLEFTGRIETLGD